MRCKNLLLPADLGQFTGVHAAHIAHSYNAELNIFFLPFDASVISTHIIDNKAEIRQGFWLLLSSSEYKSGPNVVESLQVNCDSLSRFLEFLKK